MDVRKEGISREDVRDYAMGIAVIVVDYMDPTSTASARR
jgi:hypothetical protein